jgi:AraC-like DNA-binding protein
VRVGIFLPTRQTAQIRAAMDTHDQVCVADSWDTLEALVRLEPLSVVVFNPASDGTMDATRACKLIRNYSSIPFVAYVPVDAVFVRGIARMASEGLQDVVVYRSDDSPSPFHKTLERVSSVPHVGTLVGMLAPWFRRLPAPLVDVLVDDLREPHKYASAEDIAAAADITLSALYRSFRSARLNSPKSFVVGARVFRGCTYLRDAGFSIGDVAVKLGYTQPRIFARHIECVLGECPSRLRYSLDHAEAVSRLVTWLASPTRSTGNLLKHHIARVVCLISVAGWMGDVVQFLDFC